MQNKSEKSVKIINKETQKAFEPFQERIKETAQIQIESFKAIQKQFDAIIAPIKSSQEKMKTLLEPIHEEMERIQKSIKEASARITNLWQSYPDDLITLGRHGWYLGIDASFGDPNYLANLYNKGRVKDADKYLTRYFEDYFKYQFDKIYIVYPNRHTIFDEMNKLYQDGSYYGFINLALAQIDGICFDMTRQKFFLKKKDNNYYPQVYSDLERINDSIIEVLLAPIKNNTPILAQESDLLHYPCQLNRHKILHGVYTEYGSKINALKVFSLLIFVSDLLNIFNEKKCKI
ncbi:MAG TPA: hypothetical protein PKA12_09115 [Saprospiraceae bacterium]|nr:hypothetical protein [Saprospiraceae bacterium]